MAGTARGTEAGIKRHKGMQPVHSVVVQYCDDLVCRTITDQRAVDDFVIFQLGL